MASPFVFVLLLQGANAFSTMPPSDPGCPAAEPDFMNALKEVRSGLSLPMTEDEAYFPNYISGPKLAAEFGGEEGFHHGVASGSPTHDSLIIWTRFTPTEPTAYVKVTFMMVRPRANKQSARSALPRHARAAALHLPVPHAVSPPLPAERSRHA